MSTLIKSAEASIISHIAVSSLYQYVDAGELTYYPNFEYDCAQMAAIVDKLHIIQFWGSLPDNIKALETL